MSLKRLARLVRVRKLVEQAKSAELAEHQSSLSAARQALDDTQEELCAVDFQQRLSAPTAEQLTMAAAYQGRLEKQAAEQIDDVVECARSVEAGRSAVREVWQERRLMEEVHDRASERERAEAESVDRRKQDDLALGAFARRQKGETR